jgi:hypothetical protein
MLISVDVPYWLRPDAVVFRTRGSNTIFVDRVKAIHTIHTTSGTAVSIELELTQELFQPSDLSDCAGDVAAAVTLGLFPKASPTPDGGQ